MQVEPNPVVGLHLKTSLATETGIWLLAQYLSVLFASMANIRRKAQTHQGIILQKRQNKYYEDTFHLNYSSFVTRYRN